MAATRKTSTKTVSASAKAATQKIAPPPAPAQDVKTIKASSATPATVYTQTQKPVAPKAPPTILSVPAARPPVKTISQSEWRGMVEQAAYYRAEKENFGGDPEAHWKAAEEEVRKSLTAKGIKVI